MKKTLYISALALMLAGFSLTSCSDFLEAKDKTNGDKDADSYLNSNPGALLMSAYNSLYNHVTEVPMTDEGTDLYIVTRGQTASEFDSFSFNPSTGAVQDYYVRLYGTIGYANGVMAKSSDDAQRAEAAFLRCYCYYQLTQQFGAVPYVTKYIQDSQRDYPRTELATIYESCVNELESVKGSLPTVNSHANLGAPTQEAANALIAKFYLAWGWDIDTDKGDVTTAAGQEKIKNGEYTVKSTEHFQKAAEYADKAIANYGTLTMSFEEKWSPSNENNKEVFWAVQYDRDTFKGSEAEGGHDLQASYGNYYGECTATAYKQVRSRRGQSLKSVYLFEEGDARYEATFMTTMYNKEEATPSTFTTGGYFYYYNNPKATAKIGYKYYPAYMTSQEVEDDLAANKDRYKWSSDNNLPKAYHIGKTSTTYTFKEDGTYTKSTDPDYNNFIKAVATGTTVKKYDDKNTQVAVAADYRDVVIFHASDSYLDAAEAYFMAGDETTAEARLETVRKRSISDATLAEVDFNNYSPDYLQAYGSFSIKPIDVILDERARETYAEQNRWVDLRRTNQLIRYNLAFNPNFSESAAKNAMGEWKVLRPIPSSELGNNTSAGMYQNPGY